LASTVAPHFSQISWEAIRFPPQMEHFGFSMRGVINLCLACARAAVIDSLMLCCAEPVLIETSVPHVSDMAK